MIQFSNDTPRQITTDVIRTVGTEGQTIYSFQRRDGHRFEEIKIDMLHSPIPMRIKTLKVISQLAQGVVEDLAERSNPTNLNLLRLRAALVSIENTLEITCLQIEQLTASYRKMGEDDRQIGADWRQIGDDYRQIGDDYRQIREDYRELSRRNEQYDKESRVLLEAAIATNKRSHEMLLEAQQQAREIEELKQLFAQQEEEERSFDTPTSSIADYFCNNGVVSFLHKTFTDCQAGAKKCWRIFKQNIEQIRNNQVAPEELPLLAETTVNRQSTRFSRFFQGSSKRF